MLVVADFKLLVGTLNMVVHRDILKVNKASKTRQTCVVVLTILDRVRAKKSFQSKV